MNADTIFCHAGDYQATNATTIIAHPLDDKMLF